MTKKRVHWLYLRAFFLTSFSFLLCGSPPLVHAEKNETCPNRPQNAKKARALAGSYYGKGMKAFERKDYEKAMAAFRCTQSLLPVRLTRYWIARSAEALGKNSLAAMLYGELILAPPPAVKKEELEQRLEALKKKIKKEPGPKPRQDGDKTDKGSRDQGLSHEGTAPPLKKEDSSNKRTTYTLTGYIAIGVGGTLTLLGAGLGAAYLSNKRAIEKASPGTPWNPDLKDKYDSLKALKTGTAVFLGLGIGIGVAGAALLFFRPKERPFSVTVAPTRDGAFASVYGRF